MRRKDGFFKACKTRGCVALISVEDCQSYCWECMKRREELGMFDSRGKRPYVIPEDDEAFDALVARLGRG